MSERDRARLKDAVPLRDLLEEDGYTVERDGPRLKCRCPFHDEKTPSFTIYDDGGATCFGCEWEGDVFSYLQEKRGLSFVEAMQYCAQRAGGLWPDGLPRPGDASPPQPKPRSSKRKANRPPQRSWTPILPVPSKAPPCRGHHLRLGDPVAMWPYHDADGQLLGLTARYDVLKSGILCKEFSYWTWCEADDACRTQQWCARGWQTPRPLYGLDRLRSAQVVHLFEGEKSADARRRDLAAPCLSWPGGCNAIKKVDWAPLAKREIIYWPDADDCGVKAMHALVKILHAHGCTVRVISFGQIAHVLGDRLESILAESDERWTAEKGIVLPKGFDIADMPADIAGDDLQRLFDEAAPIASIQADLVALPNAGDGPDQEALHEICASYPLTDQGNAHRVHRRYGRDIRYDWMRRQWAVWNGNHWQYSRNGQIERLAMDTATHMLSEATHQKRMSAKDYAQKAMSSQSHQRRQNMLEDLRVLEGVTISRSDTWDQNPYLLTTPSGTIDLRTGAIRDPQREDMITRCTAAIYDPDARHDAWTTVLRSMSGGNAEFESFLQLSFGMSLIGGNREEVVLCLQGDGQAGKSTLVNGVMTALGDHYAMAASMTTFLKSDTDKIRNDIARLNGPRVVIADELRGRMAIDEGTVKWLTGRVPIVARFLHAEEFQFIPQFTPWLVFNKAPYVRSDDSGIKRRLIMIPVAQALTDEQKDPRVKDAMLDPSQAGPAVLAWLVEGARRYCAHGWRVPSFVRIATGDYFERMDPVGPFLAEWTLRGPDHKVGVVALRHAYELYCQFETNDDEPIRNRAWKDRLRGEGFQERNELWAMGNDKLKQTKCWTGLALTDDAMRHLLESSSTTSSTGSRHFAPQRRNAHTRARASSSHSHGLKEGETVETVNGSDTGIDGNADDLAPF